MPNNNRNKRNSRKKQARPDGARPLPLVSFVSGAKAVTMSFATSLSIVESAAGTGVAYFFRLNSPWDPDQTGVGAAAIGYASYAALFSSYRVRKVTVRAQGTIGAISGGSFAVVTVAPVPLQAVIPSNKQAWKTMRGSWNKAIASNVAGGDNMFSVTKTYDNAWVAGISKREFTTDMDWTGTNASNPTRQNYVFIAVDSVGSSAPALLNFNIQLTYLVEWFNPLPMQ